MGPNDVETMIEEIEETGLPDDAEHFLDLPDGDEPEPRLD